MGKANRNLTEAVKNCYAEMNKKYEEEEEESSDESLTNTEEDLTEKIENVSLLIQEILLDYRKEKGLPICEYLYVSDIETYIKWIMNR